MSEERWHIHLAGGQKVKWALDEDLHWAREALAESAVFTSLSHARIVHAAWWPALLAMGLDALEGKVVVCFADNPPAFYLTQPGFEKACRRVDLWIARSREAQAQFQCLGLRAVQAPYCVDPQIFRPLPDGASIRHELALPRDAFVIGNFHRDSEGGDLSRPKAQKGPDIFLEIARELHRRLPRVVVLLAGPRRHWLRSGLQKAGIPFRFAGVVKDTDDYDTNILSRENLNRLYQALDVCVVSSRWEGGPYSVLEAVFAGRAVLSTPVGTARDALPEDCLFRSVDEAVNRLEALAKKNATDMLATGWRNEVMKRHSAARLKGCLFKAYENLPKGGIEIGAALNSATKSFLHRVGRRFGDGSLPAAQVVKSSAPAGLLPRETSLASPSREELFHSAADIAWFRG